MAEETEAPPGPVEVLCAGEALWDVLSPKGRGFAKAPAVEMRPGGGAVNLAVALHRYGRRSGLLCRVGRDALGAALRDRLADEGIDTSLITRSPSRSGVVFVERAEGTQRFVSYRGAEPPLALPEGFRAPVLAISGVTADEEHAEALAEMARKAREAGALVAVDANARPRLFEGKSPGPALRVLEEADLVKASKDDLEVLGSPERVLLVRLRPEATLVVTDGKHPARAYTPDGEVQRAPPKIKATYPLGAGDAFLAGLLDVILENPEGPDWALALERGHASAGAVLRYV